jgi:hypothetical protein
VQRKLELSAVAEPFEIDKLGFSIFIFADGTLCAKSELKVQWCTFDLETSRYNCFRFLSGSFQEAGCQRASERGSWR